MRGRGERESFCQRFWRAQVECSRKCRKEIDGRRLAAVQVSRNTCSRGVSPEHLAAARGLRAAELTRSMLHRAY